MARKRKHSRRRRSVNGLGAFNMKALARKPFQYADGIAGRFGMHGQTRKFAKYALVAGVAYLLWKNRVKVETTVRSVAAKVGISVPPVFGPPAGLAPAALAPTGMAGIDGWLTSGLKKLGQTVKTGATAMTPVTNALNQTARLVGTIGPTATRGVPGFVTAQALVKNAKNSAAAASRGGLTAYWKASLPIR